MAGKRKAAGDPTVCGVPKKDGSVCKLALGFGTNHPGVGPCKFHSTPTQTSNGSDVVEVDSLAKPIKDITPEQALRGTMELAAGQLVYCTSRVAELKSDQMWVKTIGGDMPHPWIQLQGRKMAECAKYAEMASKLGLAERKQELDEANAMLVAGLIMRVMEDIGLSAAQQKALGPAMRKHLELMAETQEELLT